MFIERVSLENVKNIGFAELEFSKFNVFVGDNGDGKSSLMTGLGYLFNPKTLEGNLDDYVRWLQDRFVIDGTIIKNNRTYDISTTRHFKKETIRKLKISGDPPTIYQQSAVIAQLEKLANSDISSWSSISSQGNSTKILFEKSSERQPKLKKIFGIEYITLASKELGEEAKVLEEKLKEIKQELALIKDKNFTLKEVPEISSIEDSVIKLKELDLVKEKFDNYNSEYKSYEVDLNNYTTYLKKQTELEKEQKEALDLIDKLNSEVIEFDSKKLKELTEQLNVLELQVKDIESAIPLYDKKVKVIEKIQTTITQIELSLTNLILGNKHDLEIIKQKKLDLEALNTEKVTLEVNNEGYRHSIKLHQLGKCPECGQDSKNTNIDEVEKSLNNNLERLKVLPTSILNLKKEIETLEQDNISYDKNVINKTNFEKNLASSKLDLETNQTELSAINYQPDKIQPLKKEMEGIEKQITSLEKIKESKETQEKDIIKANLSLQSISKNLTTLVKIEEPMAPRPPKGEFDSQAYEELKKQINIHDEKVKRKEEILKENEQSEREEKEHKKKMTLLQETILEVEAEITEIELARKIADKQLGPYLLEKSTANLIKVLNYYFQKIFPELEIEFKQVGKDTEFYYFHKDVKFPAKIDLASGFQKQAMALAFRASLTLLSGTNIFLGDEIDSDSRPHNAIKLYDALAKCDFDQYFCITQKDETVAHLKNNYNARVFYIEKGRITHIEEG